MNLILCVLAVLAQGPVEAPVGELGPEAVPGVDYFVSGGSVHWLTGDQEAPIFPDAPWADSLAPPHQEPDPMPLVPGVPDVQDPSVIRLEAYEADLFPEEEGWQREGTFDSDRWIQDGWLYSFFELGVWEPGPVGEGDFYRKSFANFAGERAFFIEWRLQSDIPSWVVDVPIHGVPCALSAYGNVGVNYHFTVSDTLVRVIRHASLPTVWVEIEPGVPHTYRLELYWDELYSWYIDGELIDSGVPVGAYPTGDSQVVWGGSYDYVEQTMKWDYVRYGKIPEDGSGDYDSDGAVDIDDYQYLHECILAPNVNAGPGCSFGDSDADQDVDLKDVAEFQSSFSG